MDKHLQSFSGLELTLFLHKECKEDRKLNTIWRICTIFLNRTTTKLEIEDYENLKTTFFRTTLAKGEPILNRKKTKTAIKTINEKKKRKENRFHRI